MDRIKGISRHSVNHQCMAARKKSRGPRFGQGSLVSSTGCASLTATIRLGADEPAKDTAAFNATLQVLRASGIDLSSEDKVALVKRKLAQRIVVSATAGGVRDVETFERAVFAEPSLAASAPAVSKPLPRKQLEGRRKGLPQGFEITLPPRASFNPLSSYSEATVARRALC